MKIHWGVVVIDAVIIICVTALTIFFKNPSFLWLLFLLLATGTDGYSIKGEKK